MPQLSDTMAAGKILVWRKKEGDKIERGDILAEVETDKANLEIESFHNGVLLKIIVPAGQTGKVGEPIAVMGNAGESALTSSAAAPLASPAPAVTAVSARSLPPAADSSPFSARQQPQLETVSNRIKASPLARKIAENRRIDLRQLRGSGPHGRIVKKDLDSLPTAAQSTRSAGGLPAPAAAVSPIADSHGQLIPFSKMRSTIARRMQESVTQAPHFFTTVSINMRQAKELREQLKGLPEYKGISINHLIIKAAAFALAREPRVNRAVRSEFIYQPDQINIGIITAIEDGLLIPVVRAVDKLALKDLVFEARAAVERAKAGRPTAADLTGGTFSISNMGMFDVENFTAIINPGQGAVLAVSSIRQEPVVDNGQITVGDRMKVTLSVDHRVIDGVMAGSFLAHFKAALECPGLLLVSFNEH